MAAGGVLSRRLAPALVVGAALVALAAAPATATVRRVDGNAWGLFAEGSLVGVDYAIPETLKVDTPNDGTGGTFQKSAAVVKYPTGCSPTTSPCFIRLGPLEAETSGTPATGGISSSADITNVNLATGTVTARKVHSECQAVEDSFTGSSTFTNMVVAGAAVPVSVTPNTVIPIPGGGQVVLNEQIDNSDPPGGRTTDGHVNAVHLTLPATHPLGPANVTIAHAHCGTKNSPGPG